MVGYSYFMKYDILDLIFINTQLLTIFCIRCISRQHASAVFLVSECLVTVYWYVLRICGHFNSILVVFYWLWLQLQVVLIHFRLLVYSYLYILVRPVIRYKTLLVLTVYCVNNNLQCTDNFTTIIYENGSELNWNSREKNTNKTRVVFTRSSFVFLQLCR